MSIYQVITYILIPLPDGLVFYDQFGRLASYQIALVSIGVALLLLGVWVVSAIQPTGQGGIEVGTWVEEDLDVDTHQEANDELEAGEGATLLGEEATAEPETQEDRVLSFTYPQPPRSTSHPLDLSFMSDGGPRESPLSPSLSVMSSNTRSRYRNRPRFGTLIPELAQAGAPTGFSIGLGAASPGFVLRSGSISLSADGAGYRRARSRSEGPQGIQSVMRGVEGVEAGLPLPQSADPRLTQSAVIEQEGRMEDVLRGWEQETVSRPWWRRMFGRKKGKIKLSEDEN